MEENKTVESSTIDNTSVTNTSEDYISAIKEIKENSVDKAAYLKLKQENKQLLDSLVNGESIQQPKKEEEVNMSGLKKKLASNDLTNLDYIETTLKLRKTLMDSGKTDPFVPTGKNIVPTQFDIDEAEKVASVLQECVDIADGDSNIFTNELQRRLVDTTPIRKRK